MKLLLGHSTSLTDLDNSDLVIISVSAMFPFVQVLCLAAGVTAKTTGLTKIFQSAKVHLERAING